MVHFLSRLTGSDYGLVLWGELSAFLLCLHISAARHSSGAVEAGEKMNDYDMKIVAEELRKKLCEEDINPMKLDSV